MTEIELMKVDILTKELIGYCKNYGIPASYGDKIHLAASIVKAGYRKQSETVKEFAGKLLLPLIEAYNQSYKSSGYDMEAARSASEIKHYIDHIKQTAEQYGKEEK